MSGLTAFGGYLLGMSYLCRIIAAHMCA